MNAENPGIDLLAIAAHPDDVELSCGGLMLKMADRGRQTAILDLTAGEMGARGTAAERACEAAAAASILGVVERTNGGLPDGRLSVTEAGKLVVASAIRRLRPRLLVAPYWKDSHPDHGYAGQLAHEGAFIAGLRKYDQLDGEAWRPSAILYWPAHYDFRPSFVVDVSLQFDRKVQAINAFASQLHDPSRKEPATNIASSNFRGRIENRSRYFGEMIGVEHGEAFLVRQAVPVDDPVELFGSSDREWNGMAGLRS